MISPNFTLTLAEVPPRMGGAAGGALQTGQRIGSALGAALLMTVYQAVGVGRASGRRLGLRTGRCCAAVRSVLGVGAWRCRRAGTWLTIGD